MGKKSNLDGSARREVVLMLLRREEPAAVLARRITLNRRLSNIGKAQVCPTRILISSNVP